MILMLAQMGKWGKGMRYRSNKFIQFRALILTALSGLHFFAGAPTHATPLSQEGKELAFCTGVLAYGITWFMANDKEGVAKVLAFQYARATAALFVMHYKDGAVSSEKMAQFNEVTRKAKPYLQMNPGQLGQMIDSCINITNRNAQIQSRRKLKPFGMSWNELVAQLASGIRRQLGL
jgi:hypothetical protein